MKFNRNIRTRLAKMFMNKADLNISKEERCLVVIVYKLLSLEGSELYMNIPGVDEIYIVSEDKTVFVGIDYNANTASVINHHFGYDLKLSNRVLDNIMKAFYSEAKKRRNLMKEEFRNNVNHSLSTVIYNLTKQTKDETHIDCKQVENA